MLDLYGFLGAMQVLQDADIKGSDRNKQSAQNAEQD